jgi:GTP pyrophosphokinase
VSSQNSAAPSAPAARVDELVSHSGGRQVLEFVAAWDALAPRLRGSGNAPGRPGSSGRESRPPSGEALRSLLEALKLAVPALQRAGSPGLSGRSRQATALGVAACLADLGADGTTVGAALLAEAVDAGGLTLERVASSLGAPTAALVADCARVRRLPLGGGGYDDASAERLRTFCLAFHDMRAILVELASRCDALRHAEQLPAWAASALALETMQLYAPMAHALAHLAGDLRFELEDRAFQVLFPQSYASVADWLGGVLPAGQEALGAACEALQQALAGDAHLGALLGETGSLDLRSRLKSRYSTMRKLLRQPQRGREAVHDLLGIRVVVSAASSEQAAVQACYRVQELAHGLWTPLPGRTKDYIAAPKPNGYASLHSTLLLPPGLELELQVRTAAMEAEAEQGSAAHTAYKGGLGTTDPANAKQLSALIAAAQAVAEHRYRPFLPPPQARSAVGGRSVEGEAPGGSDAIDDAVFRAFDTDGDGEITVAELAAVMGELQQHGHDDGGGSGAGVALAAAELMQLVDTDASGTVTAAEWAAFRRRVAVLQRMPQEDESTRHTLASSISQQGTATPSVAPAAPRPLVAGADLLAQEKRGSGVQLGLPAVVDGPAPTPSAAPGVSRNAEELLVAREASRARAMAAVDSLVASGDLFSARQLLRTVTSSDPSFSAGWTRWAGLEAEAGRPEQAMALHEAAAQWAPDAGDRARALLRAALCASRLGKRDDAARGLFKRAAQAAQRSADGDVPVLHAWACFEAKRGGTGLARQLLGDAQSRDPENVAVLHARGVLEADAGRPVAAARFFADGLAVDPGNPRLLHAWARLDAARGRLGDARARFSQALGLHPRNTYILQAWALAELRAGCPAAARALLAHGTATDPGSAPLWSAMAQLEERSGDTAAARKAYATGLETNPTNCVLLTGAARLERQAGAVDAARKLLDRALAAEPDSVAVLQEIGALAAAVGDKAEVERLRLRVSRTATLGGAKTRRGGARKPRWQQGAEASTRGRD